MNAISKLSRKKAASTVLAALAAALVPAIAMAATTISGSGISTTGLTAVGTSSVSVFQGKVGIGTLTPQTGLDVQGGALRIGSNAVASPLAGDIGLSRESAPTQGYLYFGDTSQNYFGFNGSQYLFSTKTTVEAATGALNVGNMPAGTMLSVYGSSSRPAAGYQAIGAFYSSDAMATGTGAGLALGGKYSAGSKTDFAQLAGVKENGTDGNYSGALVFYTRRNGFIGMNERMRIDSAGNVGIGTSNPLVSLHNDGDFITKGPWVDVRAFGAKGDGVTDDAPAINAAIASLSAAGGGEVRLMCSATHLIRSTIVVDRKVHLFGCGTSQDAHMSQWASTVIMKGNTVDAPAISITQPADWINTPGGGGSILENFEIMGQNGNGGDGIAVLANGVVIRNVAVYYQGRDGIRIGQDEDGVNANVWYLETVNASWNGRHGVFVNDKSSTPSMPDDNAGTAVNVNASANSGNGLRIGKGAANTFIGLLVERNVGEGVYLASTSYENSFFGGDWDEGNGSGGTYKNLFIETGAFKNKIYGSHFHNDADPTDTWTDNGTKTVIINADINKTTAQAVYGGTVELGGFGSGALLVINSTNTPATVSGLKIQAGAAGSNYFYYDRSNGWAGRTYIGNNASTTANAPTTAIAIDGVNGNRVGIGTALPQANLEVYSAGTTTLSVDTSASDRGSCLKMRDADGTGFTYCTFNNGAMACSVVPCE